MVLCRLGPWIIFHFGLLVFLNPQVLGGEVMFVQPTCGGKSSELNEVQTAITTCKGSAPADASPSCLKLCVLNVLGVIAAGKVIDSGLQALMQSTYTSAEVFERVMPGILKCSPKYVDDENDPLCSKADRFIGCLEGVSEAVCALPACPGQQQQQHQQTKQLLSQIPQYQYKPPQQQKQGGIQQYQYKQPPQTGGFQFPKGGNALGNVVGGGLKAFGDLFGRKK